MSSDDRMTVHAGAEKRFFIDMLTKDIELLPAIADLVDNSVDGIRARARREKSDDDLSGSWIHLSIDATHFEITDNAGGISTEVARNYAFRFGRPDVFKGVPGSVGQFGIGMKRAIFKLGTAFEVESTWKQPESDEGTHFLVREDVQKWADVGDWSFRFTELDEHVDSPQNVGTRILVSPLRPSVSDDLGLDSNINQLRNELSTRHQESLRRGMEIKVNGTALWAHQPSLQSSGSYAPINRKFELAATNGEATGKVAVQIIAGTVRAKNAARDAALDSGEARNFQNPGEAGWYVFCNGRLLLAGDRTATTGWGSPAAAYHPEYRNFRGYVYMDAEDAALLPWNTTKTAVDRDSQVFRDVVAQMKTALVDVQAVLNRAKSESAKLSELAKAGVVEVPATPLSSSVEATPNIPVSQLRESRKVVAPPTPQFPPTPKAGPDIQRVQYQVERDRYERLAKVLETNNGSELGRATFDYVYKREVSE